MGIYSDIHSLYSRSYKAMKIKNLLMILALIPMVLSANTLTKNEMKTLGTRAFQQKAQFIRPEAAQYQLKSCDFLSQDGEVALAILHFDAGFLILSAEDAVIPILAYDFENDINLNDLAPGVEFFLNYYRQGIAAARRMQLPQTEKVRNAWEELRHPSERGLRTETVVSPLILSKWNQNKYYNYLCPRDEDSPNGYDGHVPNGCVSIAMSQIMFYYRYPENGSGSHTNHTDYGNFYVDFSQQHYNYDAMCDQLGYYNNEVAKLIFHAGTAVDMMYGSDGSGTYSENVPEAMANYFRYSPDSYHRRKHHYSDAQWHNKLMTELDAKRPVYYSGTSEEGGHAFICDGYNSDEYFHFNFGWGGSGDGFFATENNDSVQDAVGGFDYYQGAIFNLHPLESAYPTYCQERVVTALNGTLEDGSGNYPYQNNTYCTYIITYPNQYRVQITLQSLDIQQGHDFLKFWDGYPSENNLLAEFSGGLSSHNFTFNTDSLYITFETDDSVTAQGWRLSYECYREEYNCGTQQSSAPTGEFTDNSGDGNYIDNARCAWNLRAEEGTSYIFTFEEMDISPEDHLDFYDFYAHPNVLLAQYSGNELPGTLVCNTHRVRVVFVSDNYLNGQGLLVRWSTTGVGIDDWNKDLPIYPNPASNLLHVTLPEELDPCTVTIYNMVGGVVFSETYHAERAVEIPVNQLSNGIYILKAEGHDQTFHKKIVIQH